MYEYIKGTVEQIGTDYIVIENQGIGYQILTPNPYVFSNQKGQPVIIYTYQHVREDIIALYGFETMEEKNMFKKLIGVSGIGPKGALAILAYGNPMTVIHAIENEDDQFLMKFPGVGKKTSRQMILDLKGKLHDVIDYDALDTMDEPVSKKIELVEENNELDEALLALAALGYSERELKKVSTKLEKQQRSTDQYIKEALQLLIK